MADASGERLAEGVEFTALSGNIRATMTDASGAATMRRGRPRLSEFATIARTQTQGWLPQITEAAEGVDAILGASIAVYHALSVGSERGIPRIAVGFQPYLPTADWAAPLLGITRTPRWLNRPLSGLANRVAWATMRRPLNAGRAELGQPPVRRDWRDYPALGAWSPTLAPTPGDWASHRDGARLTVTGDWPLATGPFTPPEDLATFLDAGEPPL